jgi:hypothetical protein
MESLVSICGFGIAPDKKEKTRSKKAAGLEFSKAISKDPSE